LCGGEQQIRPVNRSVESEGLTNLNQGATPGTPLRVRSQAPSGLLSVVVPCVNEEAVLPETHRRLLAALGDIQTPFEIIYVDDGSTDSTFKLLRGFQAGDPRVRVIRLARNFGHQMAVTAGLQHAQGTAVVMIDADLQDPPEVIAEFIGQWEKGHDVVYGVRAARAGETAFKLWTAKIFYRLINRLSDVDIPLDTGDFRLMDRKVVDALLAMPERARFVRGMVSWVGFSQVGVPYRRDPRTAGESKYPLVKMLRFATDGIVSFSTIPLRVATWMGFGASALALIGMVGVLLWRLFAQRWVVGWTSTVMVVLFMGGVQLISLGILGEYLGRIYDESKRRPLYVVSEKLGFADSDLRLAVWAANSSRVNVGATDP
jgi:polyisoprenyl-phosphate glycosyltransferase